MPDENVAINLSAKQVSRIVWVVLALYPMIGMGVDLIAPSLPAISFNLHVSHTIAKNLIAVYLLGFALGSFICGFLSDVFGRRKFLIGGLFVFMLVSLAPPLFPFPTILLLARFLQGLTIAGAVISVRSVLSDVLDQEQLMRVAPMISILWGIGPIVGPVIGGYLQHYFNWPACFYFFTIISFVELISMLMVVPETHSHYQSFDLKQIGRNLLTIVSHHQFLGVVILMGILYSLMIVFNTLGPFLIQKELGKTPIYFGHLALCLGTVFLLGSLACKYLLKYYRPEKIIFISLWIFLLIAVADLMLAYLHSQSMLLIVVSSLLMFLASGIIYPSAMSKSLVLFQHQAGTSGALTILIVQLTTSTSAFLMGFVDAKTAISLMVIYLIAIVLSMIIYQFLVKEKSQ